MKRPSNRTLRKFGRDAIVAVVVSLAAFVADNADVLELGEQTTPILVAVALMVYRFFRDDR